MDPSPPGPARTSWARFGVVAALVGAFAGGVSGAVVAALWSFARDARPASYRDDFDDAARGALDGETSIAVPPGRTSRDVLIDVPADVVAVHLRASSSGGSFRMRARTETSSDDAADDAWHAEADDAAEEQTIDLVEHLHEALAPGRVRLRIEPAASGADGEPLRVSLRASSVRASVAATIDAGASWSGTTQSASGFRRTIEVRCPPGADALRIDLADAAADLDLHVVSERDAIRVARSEFEAATLATAEWVVLRRGEGLPESGVVWATVTDPSLAPFPVPFRLVTSVGERPPAELDVVPPLPVADDVRARRIQAVVEVICGDGGGSGTIVEPDGTILTAYHVVERAARAVAAGRPEDAPPIVIALTADPRQVARDAFLAEVVHGDRELDVAMLRVVSGVRGTPLPAGYRFPHAPLAGRTAPALGDSLTTVGYPLAGGSGTRVTLTVSVGVVGGWERGAGCTRLKTDALVSPGSSGGAAFDAEWNLLGVCVSAQDDGAGASVGYVVPVDALPKAWRK